MSTTTPLMVVGTPTATATTITYTFNPSRPLFLQTLQVVLGPAGCDSGNVKPGTQAAPASHSISVTPAHFQEAKLLINSPSQIVELTYETNFSLDCNGFLCESVNQMLERKSAKVAKQLNEIEMLSKNTVILFEDLRVFASGLVQHIQERERRDSDIVGLVAHSA